MPHGQPAEHHAATVNAIHTYIYIIFTYIHTYSTKEFLNLQRLRQSIVFFLTVSDSFARDTQPPLVCMCTYVCVCMYVIYLHTFSRRDLIPTNAPIGTDINFEVLGRR